MRILVTGAAGFIGYHLVKKLCKETEFEVTGIDNLNDYYEVSLKQSRLTDCGISYYDKMEQSSCYPLYRFVKMDISNTDQLISLFSEYKFDIVIHLAAQAGVRYSLLNPHSYVLSNLVGFSNILECCRHHNVKHLIYASSSSVYGMNSKIPFSEKDNVDFPVSFYAATKKSNELLAHSYSHLYNLPSTGLRFFTVYGPWGRPDMAPMIFADSIFNGKTIKVFNNGNMLRDFTYIDDIVQGIFLLINNIPASNEEHPFYRIFNIGNSNPLKLMDFIGIMENAIGKKARLQMEPMQPGDVTSTYADTSLLEKFTGYKPSVPVEQGISAFISWYKKYYNF